MKKYFFMLLRLTDDKAKFFAQALISLKAIKNHIGVTLCLGTHLGKNWCEGYNLPLPKLIASGSAHNSTSKVKGKFKIYLLNIAGKFLIHYIL